MTAAPVVALGGFMGAGKSHLGAALAERLGRRFVDLDLRLEEQLGAPVATIFAERGESVFREAEREAGLQLAAETGVVVALGGGALLHPELQSTLQERGTLILLEASASTLADRLLAAGTASRPLLPDDPDQARRRVGELLQLRAPAHASVLHRLHTEGEPAAVLARLQRLVELEEILRDSCGGRGRRLTITAPGGAYPAWIGEGCLSSIAPLLGLAGFDPGPVLVVGCEPARPHREEIVDALDAAGFTTSVVELPDGETHKTQESVDLVHAACHRAGIARDRPVIAVGGGVVGDLAGFAAATYMRGVPVVQVPTTLLAMVDASLGGKTAIDRPEGKNLVGAFHHPVAVIADASTLDTLPDVEIRCGLAEVVKHGLLVGGELLERLEDDRFQLEPDDLARAMRVKAEIVSRDPGESGERAHLNLGHTFAHAIETASGHAWRHGEAVAVGLVAAARLSHALGLCDDSLPGRVESLVQARGLPTRVAGLQPSELLTAMGSDKKRRAGKLRFVLLRDVGRPLVSSDVEESSVLEVLAGLS